MSLKSLRDSSHDIRRLVALRDLPWERPVLEAAFVAHGWATVGPGAAGPAVEWGGGGAAPHFFGGDSSEEGSGRRLELGDAPDGPAGGAGFVQLPCALFWPAFGEEPEEADPDDDDDLDEEYGSDWERFPEATRADFHREYDRIGALLRAELGEPDASFGGELDEHREVWYCTGVQLELHRTDDLNSYSHYDVILVRIAPLHSTGGTDESLTGGGA
ncbi:hypothetical protein ABZ348_28860 [Streptomyces sp. NPDC005963]|uniref:hypothetical protein n=1 Tax=Streptomyces sp. NPDC005963 TaxID=3156721 RepID=UPI0033C71CF4